jgi:hypothetical protein
MQQLEVVGEGDQRPGGGPGKRAGQGGPIHGGNFRRRTFVRALQNAELEPMTVHAIHATLLRAWRSRTARRWCRCSGCSATASRA